MTLRVLLFGLWLCVFAEAGEMTGYISDAACGWNNARPGEEAKECAEKCVKAGWPPVFVRDGQMEVLKLSDSKRAMSYVGEHVAVSGQVRGDTLVLKGIRKLADKGVSRKRRI